MEKSKLIELRNIIEGICKKGISKDCFFDMDLILNEKKVPLVFDSMSPKPAMFRPAYKRIYINLQKAIKWADETVEVYCQQLNIRDKELLKSYLVFYMYDHEIEHSKQFLIGRGVIKPNYEYKQQVYNDMFGILVPKKYVLPRPISLGMDVYRFYKYQKNAYDYILERNASIEAYDTAALVADASGDNEMLEHMTTSRNVNMIIGYASTGEGALKGSYKGLKMTKKYRRLDIPQMSLAEKAREGLELNEGERKLVLETIKKTSKFK